MSSLPVAQGHEIVSDEICAGWPSTTTIDEHVTHVRGEFFNSDRPLIECSYISSINIKHLKNTVPHIMINDRQVRKLCANLVSKMLTDY